MTVFVLNSGYAQQRCGNVNTDPQKLQTSDPVAYQEYQRIENATANYAANRAKTDNATLYIPVVVHILHNGETEGQGRNLSVAQIQSQIDVLNEDYNRLNADRTNTPSVFQGVAKSANIRFQLACIDPNGQSTNGITRTNTPEKQFVIYNLFYDKDAYTKNNYIKRADKNGKIPWTTDKYLNIWVSNLLDQSGYDFAGFSSFPYEYKQNPNADGLVINYRAFGRGNNFNLISQLNAGRTATHEAGHWLSVDHIFGTQCFSDYISRDVDRVDDTPIQDSANYRCPSFPTKPDFCRSGPNGDMFMNYMDLTNDECMNLFTAGQVVRMRAVFEPGQPRVNIGKFSLLIGGTSLLCTSSSFPLQGTVAQRQVM